MFWTNFNLGSYNKEKNVLRGNSMSVLQEQSGFDLSKYKIKHRKDTILLNCVDANLGLYILECAMNIIQKKDSVQATLF